MWKLYSKKKNAANTHGDFMVHGVQISAPEGICWTDNI